jgi:hypothetical protein
MRAFGQEEIRRLSHEGYLETHSDAQWARFRTVSKTGYGIAGIQTFYTRIRRVARGQRSVCPSFDTQHVFRVGPPCECAQREAHSTFLGVAFRKESGARIARGESRRGGLEVWHWLAALRVRAIEKF